MSNQLEQLVKAIADDDPEAFLCVCELLRAHQIGIFGTNVIEPYATMYRANPLTDADAQMLRAAFVDYLSNGGLTNAPSAAHALKVSGDPALVPVLQRILDDRLRSHLIQGDTVGQLLLALNSCGESAMTEQSFSSNAHEKNAGAARKYLKRQGFDEP